MNESSLDDNQPQTKEGETGAAPPDPTGEEADWNATEATSGTTDGKGNAPVWAAPGGTRKDEYQLGGELDIEQIERN